MKRVDATPGGSVIRPRRASSLLRLGTTAVGAQRARCVCGIRPSQGFMRSVWNDGAIGGFMFQDRRCLGRGLRCAFAVLALALGSAVGVLAAEDVGVALAPAASRGPGLGSLGAGSGHASAVRSDGTLACWGDDTYGQRTPPAGAFTQVAGGAYSTCGWSTGQPWRCRTSRSSVPTICSGALGDGTLACQELEKP